VVGVLHCITKICIPSFGEAKNSNRKSSTPSLPGKKLLSQAVLRNDNGWRIMRSWKPHGNCCLVFLSFLSKKELTHG
jgi:hypothetical protein